jgi:SdrD B-like domain
MFPFFARPRTVSRPSQARPAFESLEDRRLLSVNTISGYVFGDLNNDGLFQSGETPIASNTLQLYRGTTATGTPIASAVTNASGFYQFTIDNTISTAPTTRTVLATFASAKTGWTKTAQVAQFDPSLGTLLSIDIINTATQQTEFQVENLDNEAGNISSTVSGGVTVTVPGLTPLTASTSLSDSFNAGVDDGTIDFSGAGGHDSGLKTQSGTSSLTNITNASVLQEFEGTGTLSLSAHATARSSVSGPGNVLALLNNSAGDQVQVVYHYIPSNALKPGNYTILQTSTPPGYISGLKSSGGQVIPNSAGTNTIKVTLTNSSSTNNDFGEIKASSLSGYVYLDLNNNGVKDSNEPPIPGTTITLVGTNDLGTVVRIVMQTDTSGFYHFDNLRPGHYSITETQPANYVQGKNSLGTLNGVTSGTQTGDQFNVTLGQAQTGRDYDFGEQVPAVPQVTPPQTVTTTISSLSKLWFLSSTGK